MPEAATAPELFSVASIEEIRDLMHSISFSTEKCREIVLESQQEATGQNLSFD